ncbi:MAG TPA: NAD-dependent epimerase/dehydratase family protein [Xanthobacteraceae bacterium]|nr:NAD-dependent epimerase/dehydratase family protein [Xanthobacteraceae bacterium]
MSGRILILGAAGRLGRAAAEAFRDAGWTVVSLVRPGAGWRVAPGTIAVEDEGLHKEAVLEAAPGADIVLHALNPPFRRWTAEAIPMAEVAIAAAQAAGATLMFPGNLYNYGKTMPELIDETTPMRPSGRKGALRVEIENRLRTASERGVRTIVVRAGDFYGLGRGSWFDLVIARDVSLNIVRYPGPLNVVHSWAFLPDLARTMVRLAEVRRQFAPFETFGFPGHAVTGAELIDAMQRALGRELRRKSFPWWMLWALSPFIAHWRELTELAYVWRMPHRISGEKLRAAIGEIPETPFRRAVAAALDPLSRSG